MAITRLSQSSLREGLEKYTTALGNYVPSLGVLDDIQTVTVGAGGATSILFSSIPQTYQHLHIRLLARGTSSSARNGIEFNSDTTRSNYRIHFLYGDGGSALAGNGSSFYSTGVHPSSSAIASTFGYTVMDILDYTSTAKNTVWRTLSGFDLNGSGLVIHYSGLWLNTAAVTAIRLLPRETDSDVGNFAQHTTATLYGVVAR